VYNDYIINRQTSLVQKILDFSRIAQNNLDSADQLLDEYDVETDQMITDIEGMPPYKGDSTFRNAAIESFKFYKKVFGTDYKRLIAIKKEGGEETEEGSAEMKEIVDELSKHENKLDKIFHNAQLAFARKNNMKLDENEIQKRVEKLNQQ